MVRKSQRDERGTEERRARHHQVVVGLIVGVLVGLIVAWFTEFWWWVPAGVAFGLAVGMLTKPPGIDGPGGRRG